MKMTRVRVESFTISLDGYGAGPNQRIDNPLGVGGEDLHQWLIPTRTLQRALFGKEGGTTGIDDDFASRGFQNVGAWILGRNMFGPIRGPWPDMNWKGWWGDNPPYHVPVFVLTHHARPPVEMEGNTTFHFITGGIREALDRAREAAAGRDVRIGGGPKTIQQYLREGLIDEMHIAIAPVLLGSGERLFGGVDLRSLGYECVEFAASEKATHVVLRHQGHLTSIQPPGSRSLARGYSPRSEEHTSELQSHHDLVCRLLLEKKNNGRARVSMGPLLLVVAIGNTLSLVLLRIISLSIRCLTLCRLLLTCLAV